jgi:uroporphyrin-III C-methyltransferase
MSLEQSLARLGYRPAELLPGHVWLAGAGPGDPGCLSIEALSALSDADVVVHDALVSPDVLAVASGAELVFAGKRAGRPSMKQEAINATLIRLARDNRRVLRLKGGDPYIFGRGGEEALALADEKIPFRVLPAVTSGFAALATAGIPATMRGINKAVVLATGHSAEDDDDLDWEALARTGQPIVVYMGLRNMGAITTALVAGGLAPDTPAAVIQSGTLPGERVVVATLGTLAAQTEAAGIGSPALFVVGGIVALREKLAGGGL